MNAPTRPVLRYLGGKWRLAPRILQALPPHRIYVEPFGGAASVLLRKPRSYAEIYNDLDGEVVNLFRMLRDEETARELARLVRLTPFARDEFELSYEVAAQPLERARRLVVRSFMGHGSTAVGKRTTTGFRADSNRSGSTPSRDWTTLPGALEQITDRLQGVVIENRPASDIIRRFDGPETLVYADPPYVQATRSAKRVRGQIECGYVHEMTDADHVALLDQLCGCRARVVISGYAHPLYDEHPGLRSWRRAELKAHADGARPRVEILWINAAAEQAIGFFGVCHGDAA